MHDIRYDAIHDEIFVNNPFAQAILVFRGAAQGEEPPIRIIQGPKTRIVRINQIQIQPTKGWIVAAQPGKYEEQEPEGVFVGVWSINDSGDVPPRWFIGGPKSQIKKPRGVALNSRNKELIVADMRLNKVLTYYFPEIF